MERIFVPPIKIQGIKTKLVPIIQKNVAMNKDSVWIEPFMGSGVVGFNIAAPHAVFSDTNPHIIDFYNGIKSGHITSYTVRSFLEEEGKKLEEKDAEYYYYVRDRFNREHNPLDFLFLNRSCFNGMIRFNKDYKFNVPYGHKPKRFSKAYITKIANQVKYVEEKISTHSWSFVCQSFEKTITMAKSEDFVYCDPPYIGRCVDYYDSWDDHSELVLRDVLVNSQAKFMLSTWDHNEFRRNTYLDTVWGFCNKITCEHFYHVGAKETNRNSITEALLTNYAATGDTNELLKQKPEQLSFIT